MNPDYTTAQLMADVIATVQDNAPPIVMVALLLAAVNFVIGWFMHSLENLAKAGKQ